MLIFLLNIFVLIGIYLFNGKKFWLKIGAVAAILLICGGMFASSKKDILYETKEIDNFNQDFDLLQKNVDKWLKDNKKMTESL